MPMLKGLVVDPATKTVRIKRVPRDNQALKAMVGGLVAVDLIRAVTPTLMLRVARRAAGHLAQPPLLSWKMQDTVVHGVGFLHGVDLGNGAKDHTEGRAVDCPIWVAEAEAAITWLEPEETTS